MAHHRVRRGLDLPIEGAAKGSPVEIGAPSHVAIVPTELGELSWRVLSTEGAAVKAGTPILGCKQLPGLQLVAPCEGTLREIRRGHRRVITHLVFDVAGEGSIDLPKHAPADVARLSREAVERILLGSSLWALLRTRPLDKVPTPGEVPQAIVIVGTESGPAMPGPDALLAAGDGPYLQAAVDALKVLTDGEVHVTGPEAAVPALDGLQRCQRHTFSGPHPSGDPAVQVSLLCPPAGGRKVWTIRAWDAVLIGRLLLDGAWPTRRTYAVVGTAAKAPRLVTTLAGAPLAHVAGEVAPGARWIRGSVLTGRAADAADYFTMGSRALHVLPEAVERELLGWTAPRTSAFSFHKSFLSGLLGAAGKRFDLRPGLYGGERPIIASNRYEAVVATPDLFPEQLFRSISAGDLEESLKLGLLDISAEEAALLTYICPSKVEYDVLLQRGLAQYERES